MNPTFIERWFIGFMTKRYRAVVDRRLKDQSKIQESKKLVRRNRFAALFINLVRYFKLVLELLGAGIRPERHTDAVLFYEDNPKSMPSRVQFLEWNLPHTRFEGLTYQDQLQAIPSARFIWRLVFSLLVTILISVFFRPSPLTPDLVRVVRVSLLVYSRARASTKKTVYLFHIYRIETPFVSAFLKERGVRVHLVSSSAPLSAHNRILIGDSLKVCHPYQVDEFEHYRRLGECESCELWSPETFYELEPRYRGRVSDEHYDIVGVYTQGFFLREMLGRLHQEFAEGAVRREAKLLEMVTSYARFHPDVRFVIFPHPLERRHFAQTGEYHFSQTLELSNVQLDISSAHSSTLQFDTVGLGVTLLSSIGFERIYLGFRTIFYAADLEYINWAIDSPYHNIFYTEQDSFVKAIDFARNTSHRQFMDHVFERQFELFTW